MSKDPYQVLPPLSADEFEALKADISERGVMVPVEVDEDGKILDGHHRVQICKILGLSYPRIVRPGLTEEQKVEHALALNLSRRHLTPDIRQETVVELRRKGWSLRRIATALNIGLGTAHSDYVSGVQFRTPDEEPITVTGSDGKTYSATQPDRPEPLLPTATVPVEAPEPVYNDVPLLLDEIESDQDDTEEDEPAAPEEIQRPAIAALPELEHAEEPLVTADIDLSVIPSGRPPLEYKALSAICGLSTFRHLDPDGVAGECQAQHLAMQLEEVERISAFVGAVADAMRSRIHRPTLAFVGNYKG